MPETQDPQRPRARARAHIVPQRNVVPPRVEPEPFFDDLARIAACACDAPVALVAFADGEDAAAALLIKGRFGTDDPRETAAAAGLCDHLLRDREGCSSDGDGPLVVLPDVAADERARAAAGVDEGGATPLRFFAGVPLVTLGGSGDGGSVAAAVCVADRSPRRPLGPEVADALRALARQAVALTEVKRGRARMGEIQRARKSDQEALRRAEAEYRNLFENAVEGIFRTTPDGRFVKANPMLARLYGYDSPADLMAHLTNIGHQLYVDPRRRGEFMRLLSEQDAVQGFESEMRRKDGRVIWVRENSRAVRDGAGRLLGYEGTVEDVTDRKRTETDRQRVSADLEVRVAERTAELERANAALEAEVAERRRAEAEREQAHRELLGALAERKRFYREVVRHVSRDKFHLVDSADVPPLPGPPALDEPLDTMDDYPPLREKLRAFALGAGMTKNDAGDFVLAVGEAATNAIKHAEQARCVAAADGERIVARVSDRGAGIRQEDIPATLFQAGFSTKTSLGMGYTLMLELVNSVWLATEAAGTIVQLEKRLQPEEPVGKPDLSAWEKF